MPGTFSPSMEMLFQRLLVYCSSPVDIEVALEEVRKLHDEATSHAEKIQIEACLCATINYEPRLAPRVGTLIGQLTLAQDRPILARVCDVRFLLKQVLDTSPRRSCRRFISSNTTFCVRILEGAAGSKVFNLQNPEGTIKAISESAMREVIGRRNIQAILTNEQSSIAQEVKEMVQKALDEYGAGVRIEVVQLVFAHADLTFASSMVMRPWSPMMLEAVRPRPRGLPGWTLCSVTCQRVAHRSS